MSWLAKAAFQPSLPQHCAPVNDFLSLFSSTFHTCVPTPLAFLSNSLGTLSIIAWLFAQLPQIYKNWRLQSTAGLSIFFLAEWCLGDLSNLFGALFTHQAAWQVTIGCYYVFVDLCLVGQWIWYEKLQHGHPLFRMERPTSERHDGGGWRDGDMEQVIVEGIPVLHTLNTAANCRPDHVSGQNISTPQTRPQIIFHQPTFHREITNGNEKPGPSSSTGSNSPGIYRTVPSSSLPAPSPRTVLFIACLIALAQASPHAASSPSLEAQETPTSSTALENAGTILSWISTFLYLGSRLPQLFKNWRRKSTAGLSPHLFIAAFCGNLFYSSALLTNPCAWYDFGPHGGNGWAGKDGSDREQWVLAALPFFLGAAGVLGMDASVGVQFLLYGEREAQVIDVDAANASRWHWRRVSGWMRGWFPSISEENVTEREVLIQSPRDGEAGTGYGGLTGS